MQHYFILSVVFLGFALGCSAVFSKVSLVNNRFDGLLIAINPDVPEDPLIIETLKEMITEASSVLFTATKKRAYFGDVTILVPKTWNGSYGSAHGQSYDLADVVVVDSNPVYGDSPYTLQYGQCGEPGTYIHLTPEYLRNESFVTDFGPRGKAFVHEWAHLRWGVYDEAPSENYADFYFDSKQDVQATRCPLGLKGQNFYFPPDDPNNYRVCRVNPNTGLPEAGCVFVPYSDTPVNASLMSHQYKEEIVEFCDDQVEANPQVINHHNTEAPNEQNRLCDLRSVWSVIRSSVDFSNNNFPNSNIVDVTPKFSVAQAKPFEKFVLVLDVSGSMGGYKIEDMKTAASLFISQFLPDGTKVGIVAFESKANILTYLVTIDNNREYLVDLIGTLVSGGGTCIGCGIEHGIEVLESDGSSAGGGHLLVLTDGEENGSPMVIDTRYEVLKKEVVVDSIFFGVTVANQDLQDLSEDTHGLWFFNDATDSGALLESFKQLANNDDGDVYNENFQIYGNTFTITYYSQQNGTVFIDSTIGNQTVFTFSYSNNIDVILYSPDGTHLCTAGVSSCDGYATEDSSFKTIMFSISGTATVGSWLFQIITGTSSDSVDVIVTSMAADREVEPMVVESGMSDIDPTDQEPIVVYAKVTVGYTPVLGAEVIATVSSPSGTTYTLTLLDSGSAPDVRKFDGVYSRYFTQFAEEGRYSVSVIVTGMGNQTASTYGKSRSSSALYNPGSVENDGTLTLNPKGPTNNAETTSGETGVSTSELDPFTRVVSPGGFSYTGAVVDPSVDILPPSKVIDLQASQVDVTDLERGVRLTFSAPGSDYDSGTAAHYEIRYSYNGTSGLVNNFENNTLVEQDMIIDGNISAPQEAGNEETIVIELINIPEDHDALSIWFAMRASDHASLLSPTSNVAMMNVFVVPYVPPTYPTNDTTTTTTTTTTSTTTVSTPQKSDCQKKLEIYQLTTVILAPVCLVLVCSLIATIVMHSRLSKQRKKFMRELEEMRNSHEMRSQPSRVRSAWTEEEPRLFPKPEVRPSSHARTNNAYMM